MVTIPVEPPITEYLHTKAARARIPLNGTFELTPCCNMDCRMCYVRMSKEKQESIQPLKSADDWLALGREAKEQGLLYLLLTGGEPFIRPDLPEIVSGLHRMGMLVSINSNGTLIDEKTVSWLKQTPPVRINITLYGASDATYDRLCRNPKGFTQVTHAIDLLQAAGISIKLNCSVTPYNEKDLEAIFAFAGKRKLILQATSYMFPPLRKDPSMIGNNFRFTPEEAAYQSARIEALQSGEDAFLKRMQEHRPLALPEEKDGDCPVYEDGDGIRCRAGKCSFWITWDGKMLPCGMLSEGNAPDVFADGFAASWDQVVNAANKIKLPGKCHNCKQKDLCRACAAMVLTETGDYHTVPDYRCRMSHAYPGACALLEREFLKKRMEKK